MRTSRMSHAIEKLLETGPRTTGEIKDFINAKYRHGTTMQSLVNVLAKDQRFCSIGYRRIRQSYSSYDQKLWDLKDDGVRSGHGPLPA